ncbi:MAG: hypothetical protein WBM65_05310 [Sedimenticolaceae bacterium]
MTPGIAMAGKTAIVTNGNDDGPGSFRAAVDAANDDDSIDEIRFAPGLVVDLKTEVVYTGDQHLEISGRGATVSGATGDPAVAENSTWGGGLFVSESAGDLEITNISFVDSFNNGVAVFLPESDGTVKVKLTNVKISGSQFHGLLVDGQSTTGYNTDDVIHPLCEDPYPVDAGVTIEIEIKNSTVVGNGDLDPSFDTSIATGCPQDFDGVRVDQGGDGDIEADIENSHFDGNLADGMELDETEDGSVYADVKNSTFEGNGETVPPSDRPDLTDFDDGFDIDEAGNGDIVAKVKNTSLSANFDEGLDLDEAGEGDVEVEVKNSVADGNTDEGLKADEEDGGDLVVKINNTSSSGNKANDGVSFVETGDGDLEADIKNSHFDSNGIEDEGDGLNIGSEDAGVLEVNVKNSTATENVGRGIDAEHDGDDLGSTLDVKNSNLSGNADGPIRIRGDIEETLKNVIE